MANFNYLGFGLGLRPDHYLKIIETKPKLDWFEIVTEDYLSVGGNPLYFLDEVREQYPVVMHGVSMSIGSTDPLDWDYLKQVKELAERINPAWISDHLCWTGVNGVNLHDLMPLPYTEEALQHVVNRVKQVQDYLGQQILLENPSTYVTFKQSDMTEWEFFTRLTQEADCRMLFDVNNIYVSCFNHGWDPIAYLDGIPADRVQQFHLAGHSNYDTHIIDTHDHEIIDDVWDLYAESVKRFGHVSTMIERDDHIPELEVLLAELDQAKKIAKRVFEEKNEQVA